MKFGMYYDGDNLIQIIFSQFTGSETTVSTKDLAWSEIISSWFTTIFTIVTLWYYSNLMKKSIDK